MKGFNRQRGSSGELWVYLGIDPVTGKKRFATRTVRGGKREAQSVLAEMITEAERGLTVRTTAAVGELLDAWFEFAAPDFSPKAVKETRSYIDRSLMPTLGSKRLAKLKSADHDAFYRRLLASGGSSGRPLAPAAVVGGAGACTSKGARRVAGSRVLPDARGGDGCTSVRADRAPMYRRRSRAGDGLDRAGDRVRSGRARREGDQDQLLPTGVARRWNGRSARRSR